jgi:putative spermidine/putrescine transport system permease protein
MATSVTIARLTREEARFARRDLSRRRVAAFALVVPLLLFILFAFFAPIATMLYRSVYNPVVAELVPATLESLDSWDGEGTPDRLVLTTMAIDLKRLQGDRDAGRLAEALNRNLPGTSSVVKSTARRLGRVDDAELAADGATLLLDANPKWADPEMWRTVREAGRIYTDNNFLTALDLERTPGGDIQLRGSAQIYVQLYLKTFRIALIITLLCMLLGYPLSYYLSRHRR